MVKLTKPQANSALAVSAHHLGVIDRARKTIFIGSWSANFFLSHMKTTHGKGNKQPTLLSCMYQVHVPEPERLFLAFPLPPTPSRLSRQVPGFRRAFQHLGETQRACRCFRYGSRPLRTRGSEEEGKRRNRMSKELRISISNAMTKETRAWKLATAAGTISPLSFGDLTMIPASAHLLCCSIA